MGHTVDPEATATISMRMNHDRGEDFGGGPASQTGLAGGGFSSESSCHVITKASRSPKHFPLWYPRRAFKKINHMHGKAIRLQDSPALPYPNRNLTLCREERRGHRFFFPF